MNWPLLPERTAIQSVSRRTKSSVVVALIGPPKTTAACGTSAFRLMIAKRGRRIPSYIPRAQGRMPTRPGVVCFPWGMNDQHRPLRALASRKQAGWCLMTRGNRMPLMVNEMIFNQIAAKPGARGSSLILKLSAHRPD